MPVAAVAAVEGLRVDAVQLPHGAGEVRVRRLQEQVVVVVHEAVGEDVQAVAARYLREDLEEALPV